MASCEGRPKEKVGHVAKAQGQEPENPCTSPGSPTYFLCGLGEKKVQLCSASYSFLCQMGRIRVTCSAETLQGTNELMPQKILDIVEMWSLEGTISSASYNNCTCGSFHSLLWECSNEGKKKRKSCGSTLRYNDRIMRRTREDKRNTLLTPLMQDSGGHRLCTEQTYILCYSILFYFLPLRSSQCRYYKQPQYHWPQSGRFMVLSREHEIGLQHGRDWKQRAGEEKSWV